MCWYSITAIIKDILLSVAAITTVLVAIIGLYTWKRELHGKARFEAAQKLIRATYILREEVRICRSPFTSSNEYPPGYNSVMTSDNNDENGNAYAHVYHNRWKPVSIALANFDAGVIESEIFWGEELRLKTDELRNCVNTLNSSIFAYIEDKYSGGKPFKDNSEFAKTVKSDIWTGREESNKLSSRIKNAINAIEIEIKPHLKK